MRLNRAYSIDPASRRNGIYLAQKSDIHTCTVASTDSVYMLTFRLFLGQCIVATWRRSGYVEMWWLCRDVVAVWRYGGCVKIWWLCRDVVDMWRRNGYMKMKWLCGDVAAMWRCSSYNVGMYCIG